MSYQARFAGLHQDRAPDRAGAPANTAGKRTLVDQLDATSSMVQRKAIATAAAPEAVHVAAAHGTADTPGSLPYGDTIQRAFGRHDVSRIGAHVGGRAAEGAARMGAQAYATGDQVAFAAAPTLHTAAHEAAHVLQQRGGVALEGGVGAEGDVHERHADAVADRVVQGASAEDLLDAAAPGTASDTTAVQRKVTVGDGARETATIEGVELTQREVQVLGEMIAADVAYTFADDGELTGFVKEVAKTDWNPTRTDQSSLEDAPDQRVETFARGRLGQHIWASDHRQEHGEMRVTRTNTMPQSFRNKRTNAGLPETSHREIGKTRAPKQPQKRRPPEIQHVYSAMMTSLSPGARDDEREDANAHVHDEGSVMNCEQFVAYSLWGGGVIRDWELAMIFAACAQQDSMNLLYEAMGFAVSQRVTFGDAELLTDTNPLAPVCTLFELNERGQVSHMLLYCNGTIIELNAGDEAPAQWKGTELSQTQYIERESSGGGSLRACPLALIPGELQKVLTRIMQELGSRVFDPKQINSGRQDEYSQVGFLKMAR